MTQAEHYLEEGHGELALGELENAAAWYRKATEAEPENFDAWHALSMVFLKIGNYAEAIAAGKKALELQPNDQMAYTSLSIAYARDGKIKEAEAMAANARIISWGGKAVNPAAQPEQ